MKYTFENGIGEIYARAYTARLDIETIAVTVGDCEMVRLDVRSGLDVACGEADTRPDDSATPTDLSYKANDDAVTFTWIGTSSLWERKEYVLVCREDAAEYFVRVHGAGAVMSVNYFSGNMTEPCHGSDYDFSEGYTPVVSLDGSEPYTFAPIRDFRRFSYLTVPPMFVYAFRAEKEDARLAFGLVARPGEHNFTDFAYRTTMHRWGAKFWLSTDQSGHTEVSREWQTPSVFIYRADSYEDAVEKYSARYFELGYAVPHKEELRPRFWYGPIACGWLEQLASMYAGGYGLVAGSRQELYEGFVERLHGRGIEPKILIIDDKWQKEYGTAHEDTEKWPDLAGFIRRMRRDHGIHTFMWYKMWDSEGVPEEYCVFDERENRYVVDPTNPGYLKILRDAIHYIISDDEGCLGADGLKIDFAFWQPVGRKARSYSGKYGVELFRELVSRIREYMKAEKPYAVLNCSPCHPYFADLCDQARLHDYDYRQRNSFEEFSQRAALYRAALPGVLIDTDGCGHNTRRDTMRYLTRSAQIGIPDIYCVSDTPYLSLSDEDWQAVADAFAEYSRKADELYGE